MSPVYTELKTREYLKRELDIFATIWIPILSQYLIFLMKVLMVLSMSNYEDAAGTMVPGVLCDVESKQRNNYIEHIYLWKRNYFPILTCILAVKIK